MKTVLIVGASRGLGQEFVRQYDAAGWRVIATARDERALAELIEAAAIPFDLQAGIGGAIWPDAGVQRPPATSMIPRKTAQSCHIRQFLPGTGQAPGPQTTSRYFYLSK